MNKPDLLSEVFFLLFGIFLSSRLWLQLHLRELLLEGKQLAAPGCHSFQM